MICSNNTIAYKEFSDLLPHIFSQIVDAVQENRHYRSSIGSVYVTLSNGNGSYAPKIVHTGSLMHVDVGHKVRKFFNDTFFASYFETPKLPCERAILKSVFKQIISGTELQDHPYGLTTCLQVSIKKTSKDAPLTFKIEKQKIENIEKPVIKDEEKAEKDPEDGNGEQGDPLALLNQFLSTKNLQQYFGVQN